MTTSGDKTQGKTRRKAREDALQILFQLDLNHDMTPEAALYHFENHFIPKKPGDMVAVDPFTQRLVSGVTRNLKELDGILDQVSEHWRTGRMPAVDRNILRIGAFELHHCDDIPATVTINEMIEVAKQYGSENSAAFINGVLDRLKTSLQRPNKAP